MHVNQNGKLGNQKPAPGNLKRTGQRIEMLKALKLMIIGIHMLVLVIQSQIMVSWWVQKFGRNMIETSENYKFPYTRTHMPKVVYQYSLVFFGNSKFDYALQCPLHPFHLISRSESLICNLQMSFNDLKCKVETLTTSNT